MTLDPSTGDVSGTPTSGGRFSFTITARDAFSEPAERAFTWNVIEIVESQLPGGMVGDPYSTSLHTRDQVVASWEVRGGPGLTGLPPGLTLNEIVGGATISGTPMAPGTFTFIVRARFDQAFHDKTFSITIEPRPEPPAFTATKRGNPVEVEVGQVVTFGVDIANTGTVPITRVDITDQVPPSFTVGPVFGGCQLLSGNVVKCSFEFGNDPVRPAGPSRGWVLYQVRPTQVGTFINTAAVTANQLTTVNTIAETNVIGPEFTVTKDGNPDAVQVGGQVTFAVDVRNTGRVPIRRVDITDVVPPSFTVGPVFGGCQLNSGNIVKCSFDVTNNPVLPGGPTRGWVLYQVRPTQTGTFINTADVTANGVTTVRGTAETTVIAPDFSINLQMTYVHVGPGVSFACTSISLTGLPSGSATGATWSASWSGPGVVGQTQRTGAFDANNQALDRQQINQFGTYTTNVSVTANGVTKQASGSVTVGGTQGTCTPP